jgi:sugar O-acyltransferase (sialic acid O-acetyltransferase NeuD family)
VTPIVIIGTGGMAREAMAWLQDGGSGPAVIGFLDDDREREGTTVAGLPVLGPVDLLPNRVGTGDRAPDAVVAVGSPSARMRIMSLLADRSVSLVTVIHPSATIGPRTTVGAGAIVCPQVVLTCDVTLQRGAIVNYGAIVGHDCEIGEAAFIAPGAHVAGNVRIGRGADVGIGASIIQGVTVGDHAVIGAGAVVIRDVEPGTTVVGVPARPIARRPEGSRDSE